MSISESAESNLPTDKEIQELYGLLGLTKPCQQQTSFAVQNEGFHYLQKYSPLKEVPITTSANMGA